MRSASNLSRSSLLSRFSGRGVLIGLGLLFLVVVVFGRAIARFYVDALWYQGVGRSDVFWGVLWAKVLLFVVFFAVFVGLAVLNLYLADRSAPTSFPANVHPYVERFHEIFGHRLRLVRYGTAVLFAFMLAMPAVQHWQDWLLFRNSTSFGIADQQFDADVSFYVFELPFISFAVDWLFAAMIVVLLLTIGAHLLNGGVMFTSTTPTVRSATKVHLAVLLSVLAAVKAADYWLTRYEVTNERRGFVQGATYAVVKAQLPALMLLVLVALLTSGLYLSTIKTGRWRYPIVASGLWMVVLIVGGLVYPAIVQSLVVKPNQAERELPYIARNVDATRLAMGIDNVTAVPVEFGRLTRSEVEGDLGPLQNVRLLNPTEMKSRFVFDRGRVAGLTIDDLDVDRYDLGNDEEQVVIAARELDIDKAPNQSWQGRHLVNTRGCGLVLAPVSQVTTSDRPAYQDLGVDRPELYFSPTMSGYAIARTDATESTCGADGQYEGTSGVPMSSFLRRSAVALAFLDYNVVGSGSINSDSQLLWVRDVRDRVEKLAPFLSYDGDPYPVAVDGTVQWVIDGYTSTTRYPYAQRLGSIQLTSNSGLSGSDNYVRNSVKAVVDAYTGDVTFYVMDPDDPILLTWQSAFPDLFTPLTEMPDELRDHLRYPEDLFRVQTELYSKYQIAAADFFERKGAWSVAQAPSDGPRAAQSTVGTSLDPDAVATEFASESNVARFVPYYTLFRNPDTGVDEFVLLRPFVPFSTNDARTELQAYMTASSDPDSYGSLTSYEVQGTDLPDGPLRVTSQAESEPNLSQRISFDDNVESGSEVRFGDLQIVPVADGLVYVRPYYVLVEGVTEYRFVIVSHNQNSAFGETLQIALAKLFPGFDVDVGDRIVVDADDPGLDELGDSDPPVEATTNTVAERPPLADDADPVAVLAEVENLFDEADALLSNGDLAGYEAKLDEARALIEQALAGVGG